MRWLLCALVLLLGAAGCSSSQPPPPAAAPATTTVPSSTASTPPSSVPFETEVRAAAVALLELRNEVFQRPDVARVAEYIAPTCTCLERERAIIESLAAEGLRWTAPAVVPRGVLIDDPDPAGPSLTLVAEQPASDIVGPDGTSVESVTPKDAAAYRLILLRDDTGSWRINALEGIDLNPSATSDVVEAGLP